MDVPWRTVEAMHWEMGKNELEERARGTSFADRARPNVHGEALVLPEANAMLSGITPASTRRMT